MNYSTVVNYFSEFFGAVSNYSRAIRGSFRSRLRRAAFRTPVAEFKTIWAFIADRANASFDVLMLANGGSSDGRTRLAAPSIGKNQAAL
jgi:hypothetical protein